jgi:hypothetical protein
MDGADDASCDVAVWAALPAAVRRGVERWEEVPKALQAAVEALFVALYQSSDPLPGEPMTAIDRRRKPR